MRDYLLLILLAAGKVNIPNIYHFGSPTPNYHENVSEMLTKGVPVHIANQISKVNKHHPLLAVLGILPNQLRDLLKTTTSTCDEAFEDISFTLFWHGYQIWKLRRSKVNRYWKEIARNEWKPHKEEKCRNPFHFLSRHRNLSQQRRTPCPCSREVEDLPPIYRTQALDSFFHPQISNYTVLSNQTSAVQNCLYQTREDYIRGEHDRVKITSIRSNFFV